jgi:hypothetical protein
MAILLAEMLIPLGASLQAGCQLQKAGVPLTDAISFQPAVGVIETFSHTCCFGVGVNISEAVECSSVVFWVNGSGVIPGFPEVPATS